MAEAEQKRQDLPPQQWGNALWTFIHCMGSSYDPKLVPRDSVIDFVNSLQHLLPCSICREHWPEVLKELPVVEHLHSREAFFNWTIRVHDMVSNHSVKSRKKPTEVQLRRMYKMPIKKVAPQPKPKAKPRAAAPKPKPRAHVVKPTTPVKPSVAKAYTPATAARMKRMRGWVSYKPKAQQQHQNSSVVGEKPAAKKQQLYMKKPGCRHCGQKRL